MRPIIATSAAIWLLAAALASAQGPRRADRPESNVDEFIARLMAFDSDDDGRLTRQEVTDARLQPLFDRLDTNHDGYVTKDEMSIYFTKESESIRSNRPEGFGGFGPPPNGRGPGQGPPGGPGDRPDGFGPPRPGQVFPMRLQEELQLTQEQKADLAKLQADVDARLKKILTKAQQRQLDEMRDRRPGMGTPPEVGQPPEERGPPKAPGSSRDPRR
ncbi:MAG TPA: EF-hand domain-containing protein [Pirellulales bacterium]|nr:EF-hand domain-containing protein [Pirellulales bacterium]